MKVERTIFRRVAKDLDESRQDTNLAQGQPLLKAMLGVSVTTDDYVSLRDEYLRSMKVSLEQNGLRVKKAVYKAAHLLKQCGHKMPAIISQILENLEPEIQRLDVYCFYSRRDFISVYGKARGERLSPNDFIERHQDSFPHACAWQYFMDHEKDVLLLDHFTGKVTPMWRLLEAANPEMYVYYSGGECNALISIADLTLRIINTYQSGIIDGQSLLKPITDRVPSLEQKLRFHNMGDKGSKLKELAPDEPIEIDLSSRIKHPIFFMVWSPHVARTEAKPTFEWSPIYDNVMRMALIEDGCVKFLDFDKDVLLWDKDKDYIVPWTKDDEARIQTLEEMGHEIPKILTKQDIVERLSKYS